VTAANLGRCAAPRFAEQVESFSSPQAKTVEETYKQVGDAERVTKRNTRDGYCGVCRVRIRALEGIVEADDSVSGYRILCPEHMPDGVLDPPKPPDASRLPSIHLDEERYER
jgi:hypothetical protein